MSFCPFCSYHCRNDSTFLNYIVSFHYNVGYGCSKCVEEVFITSQSFKVHSKNATACLMTPPMRAEAHVTASEG